MDPTATATLQRARCSGGSAGGPAETNLGPGATRRRPARRVHDSACTREPPCQATRARARDIETELTVAGFCRAQRAKSCKH